MSIYFIALGIVLLVGSILLFTLLPELWVVVVLYFVWWRRALFPEASPPPAKPGETIERIRSKIVEYVDQQPSADAMTLEQLKAASAITADDVQQIKDRGLVYHPISPTSPDDAIIFVSDKNEFVHLWYKGIDPEVWTFQESADKAYSFHYPYPGRNPSDRSRTRTLIDNRTGNIVYSYRTRWQSIKARWQPDGSVLATLEKNESGQQELILIFPEREPIKEVRLPSQIDRTGMLAKKYRNMISESEYERVERFQWWQEGQMTFDFSIRAAQVEDGMQVGKMSLKSTVRIQCRADGTVRVIDRGNVRVHKTRA